MLLRRLRLPCRVVVAEPRSEREAAYGRFVGTPSRAELERFFFLDDADKRLIARRRGDRNRAGFALQLGTVRFLGMFLADPTDVPAEVIAYVIEQVGAGDASCLDGYMGRRATRFEHTAEIAVESATGTSPQPRSSSRGGLMIGRGRPARAPQPCSPGRFGGCGSGSCCSRA